MVGLKPSNKQTNKQTPVRAAPPPKRLALGRTLALTTGSTTGWFNLLIAKHNNLCSQIGRVFTEVDVATALLNANVTWMRYYEWFQSNGWSASIGMSVANGVAEAHHDIPVMAHSYGKADNCSDPNDKGIGSAIAAFLLIQTEYVVSFPHRDA